MIFPENSNQKMIETRNKEKKKKKHKNKANEFHIDLNFIQCIAPKEK